MSVSGEATRDGRTDATGATGTTGAAVAAGSGRRVRSAYLALTLAAAGGYAALPRGTAAQVLFAVVALSVPAVGLVQGRHRGRGADGHGTDGRGAWTVLLGGLALSAVGEVVDVTVATASARAHTGPTVDLIFLTAYLVQLAGVMALFQAQSVSRRRFGWFDALSVFVVVGTFVWSTLYRTIFGGTRGDTPLDWLTRFGGAVLGFALLVTAVRLAVGTRGRRPAFVLVAAAYALQLLTDAVGAVWHGYVPGGRMDALWAVAYALLGAALVDTGESVTVPRAPTEQADVEIRHTLVLQAGVTLVLAVLVIVQARGAVPAANLAVWGAASLVVLLLTRVRVFGLLRAVGEASATENQRRLTAMVASSRDVLGLADPDGTIRYLTPSIAALTGVPVDEWLGRRFDRVLDDHLEGLEDLAVRCSALAPGQSTTWECTVRRRDGGDPRTVKLTVANETAIPEVNGWVIAAHDVTDEARLTAELRYRSLHDTLTGLPNRALLFDRVQHALDRLSRAGDQRLAVVLVDIDDFKAVNDGMGHIVGDELLRAVGRRLVESLRQGDTVARLGGDEFALLLEDVDADQAAALAERALAALALPVQVCGVDLAVRASAGVVCQGAPSDPVDLLRAADLAMYAAKHAGKARVTRYDDAMQAEAQRQLELRMDLSRALERGELRVVYQPIVDTTTRRVKGVEALVRWHHPRRGLVPPLHFVPVAEQSGLIHAIGAWVLRTACTEAASWSGAGAAVYVSVNVSAPQLVDTGFADIVDAALADSGLAADRLLLEITESMMVDDTAGTAASLAGLRRRGVRVAIDDFGTGYSSLAYLGALSADVVKIDRSFVHELSTNDDHRALTRTILTLAEGLGMTTIAEGVEWEQDLATLVELGCPLAQGYLFAKPVPPDELPALFASADATPG